MERNEILKKFIGIIIYQLDINNRNITEESIINDIGADSLDLIEMIIQAEDEFDIEVLPSDIEKFITVKDAVDHIENLLK